MQVDPREYMSAGELMDDELEALLNKFYPRTPFTCSVAVSGDGERYAAVGVKLFGKSVNRKGRWTRCSIAASCPISEGLAGLVPKMRKLYREYTGQRHPGINFFYPKRRTRSMAGK